MPLPPSKRISTIRYKATLTYSI